MVGRVRKCKYVKGFSVVRDQSAVFPKTVREYKIENAAFFLHFLLFVKSHGDEKRYHDEMVGKLQRKYQKLQDRIDAMYVDKLDAKITQEFFDRKNSDWRTEQAEILRKIEKHQNANSSYLEEGVQLLELTQRLSVFMKSKK